jgi:DNA repair exonuclease
MSSNQNTTFAHVSDAHIGHRQYNVKKRLDDMQLSLLSAAVDAAEQDVDFAVFSGDLFHNKDVDALTLSDAEKCLDKFQEEDIPVAAIQGNHDDNLYKEDLNWLEYLHQRGKLILLEAEFGDGEMFKPCESDVDERGKSAGFVDFGEIRVFGVQYMGRGLENKLGDVAEGIRTANEEYGEPEQTVLLGHFGIEGQVPKMSGLEYSKLEPLREVVDYFGVGHLHKQYSIADWVYSPGSLEVHNIREDSNDLGYYTVEDTDDGLEPEHHLAKRRPFFTVELSVDGYQDPESLESGLQERVKELVPELREKQNKEVYKARGERRQPVIYLRLTGLLEFSRSRLDMDRIRSIVKEDMNPVHIQVRDTTETKDVISILEEIGEDRAEVMDEQGQIDTDKLEVKVFEQLVEAHPEYGEQSSEVAGLLRSVKSDILAEEPVDAVADVIREERRELFVDTGGENE